MSRRLLAWLAAGALVLGATTWIACIGAEPDPTCVTYCKNINDNCTGDDQQYPDGGGVCQRICGMIPAGEAGVAQGDTIACRNVSISATKDEQDPNAKHDECVGGGIAAKQCTGNDPCQAFCDVDLVACPTSLTKYTDVNDCVSKCHNWGQGFTGPILDSTGNTLQCRVYHLELSQTGDPNDLTTHCPHTGDDSARCQSTDGGTDAGGDAGADAAADATAD